LLDIFHEHLLGALLCGDLILDFEELLVEIISHVVDFLDDLIVASLGILSLLLHQRLNIPDNGASKPVHLVIFLLMQVFRLLNQNAAEVALDPELVIDRESYEVQIGLLLVDELLAGALHFVVGLTYFGNQEV
jgi:hypothetical protein